MTVGADIQRCVMFSDHFKLRGEFSSLFLWVEGANVDPLVMHLGIEDVAMM